MHLPLLQDILIIIGLSVIVVFLLQKLRLPSILGFLITGLLIGPNGLTLIGAVHEVELIAEIGVILLLFVIGMELSLKQLISIRKTIFVGGLLQVGVAVIIATLVFKLIGFEWNQSVFIGFLFSLSSTAIVLKILQDRNEISAPHGRNALGILIFQDLIAIPMLLVTPIIAGNTTNIGMAVLDLFVKSAVVIVITIISARYLVPRLMLYIVKTKSKELFLMTTLALCFAVAFLTSQAGLSLALGAFLAGLIISESEFSHQATSIILPFKELFTSFFFISIGMLLNIGFFVNNAGIILILVFSVIVLKILIVIFATLILGHPPRVVILTGLALFQIGEFSFIISKVGIDNGLLTNEMNQYFLAVSIITMFLTPFVMMYSEKLATFVIPQRIQKKLSSIPAKINGESNAHSDLKNHLIIIGYGINGKNVAKAAQYSEIPYVILELNPDTVKQESAKGENIHYGDATQTHILESINLHKARVVVVAISDPMATKQIVTNIRLMSQSVYIIVRTRYVSEIRELNAIGADEVIPEEFETSITIFSRVLHNLLVPLDEIEELVQSIKEDNYKFLYFNSLKDANKQNNYLKTKKPGKITDFKLSSVRLKADSGEIVGKTIAQAHIRKTFGINILAISRNDNMIYPVLPDEKLHQNDLLYISGDTEQINYFYKLVN